MISDQGATAASIPRVRLARLDATDVGAMTGQYIGVFDDEAVALNGLHLMAMGYDGKTTQLGTLVAAPAGEADSIVVSPDLSQWLYTTVTDSQPLTAQIHLGSATGDRIVATLLSPNGNGIFTPYAWNTSGVYVVLTATGIGGAGPFLDYHFPLYRFDIGTGAVAQVQPSCVAYDVLTSGTVICALNTGNPKTQTGLDIRPPGAPEEMLQVPSLFAGVTVAADASRLALVGRGGTPADAEYQVETTRLSGPALSDFGPPGYVPVTWLPDGRLLASRMCLVADSSPTACDPSHDGETYVFSADGSSSSLFFKFPEGARVAGVIA